MLTLLDWLLKAQFALSALIAYNVVLACWDGKSGLHSRQFYPPSAEPI